jgi:arabinofuranosyltransferase
MPHHHPQTDHLNLRILAIALLVSVLCFFARHDQIDDALIYARYIANALHGLGLVFNAGEHINALTSPVYSYLVLATAKILSGQVLLATSVVSGIFFFLTCCLAETLVPFAGLLLASTGYFYSLVGMESSAFLGMTLLAIFLVERERYIWLPTVCILLLLTRFESGALLLPLAIVLYRRKRWPSAASFLPAGLIALLYLALNRYWYGAFLPASAGAKLGQGRSGYWGHWPFAFFHTAYQLKPEFLPTFYILIFVALFSIPGVLRFSRSGKSAFNPLVLPFLAILLAFYLLFNIPGYKWYYAPFFCFAMIYACAALPRATPWRWAIVPLLLLSWISALHRFRALPPPSPTRNYTGIANWLLSNTPATARIEAGEIGTLGFYCQRCYLIDILGLTLPKNAQHIAHADSRSWLAEDHPDYVVVHVAPWVFEDVVKQSPDYERVPVDFGNIVYLLRRKHTQPH